MTNGNQSTKRRSLFRKSLPYLLLGVGGLVLGGAAMVILPRLFSSSDSSKVNSESTTAEPVYQGDLDNYPKRTFTYWENINYEGSDANRLLEERDDGIAIDHYDMNLETNLNPKAKLKPNFERDKLEIIITQRSEGGYILRSSDIDLSAADGSRKKEALGNVSKRYNVIRGHIRTKVQANLLGEDMKGLEFLEGDYMTHETSTPASSSHSSGSSTAPPSD